MMASCLPDSNPSYSAVSPLGRSGLMKQENNNNNNNNLASSLSPGGLLTVATPTSTISSDYLKQQQQDELITAQTVVDEPLRASVSENVWQQPGGQYLVDTTPDSQNQVAAANNKWTSSQVVASSAGPTVIASTCAVCHEPIYSRYLLVVLGLTYHESCLRCSTCHLPLIEVGNKCYRNRAGVNLCEKDYALIKQQQSYLPRNSSSNISSTLSTTNTCNSCFRILQPSDWVTTVHDKKYHADCFACFVCRQRLLKGSSFVMVNNQIWCEKDYHSLSAPGPMMSLHHHHTDVLACNSPVSLGQQQQLY